MDLGLEGKTALVAASSEGLGYATAAALAGEGARTWIGSRDRKKTVEAVDRIRLSGSTRPGTRVEGAPLDMTDGASIERWVAGASAVFDRGIDALVVNSGGPPPGRFSDFGDDEWRAAFDLLLLSAVRLVRAALPGLVERKGSVLVISSTSVKEPIDGLILSNALRSATVALAKSLSAEFASAGIRVNCLSPGRIATGRVERIDRANAERAGISPEEAKRKAELAIPLGRYGNPDEFGRAACWLLSPAASYITGQLLTADGGMLKGTW
jgi:3-oxoacyl-[acyl-carrier protein] reductase